MPLSITRRSLLLSTAALFAAQALPLAARAEAPGRITIAADSEPPQLNPAIAASNGTFFIASKVIEPLAEASYEGTGLRPLLATGWEGSEDGLSVTFHLREGVTWHDGKPFTAEDVAFSAVQVWKPLQNIGRTVFANLVAVDTPDAQTAVFRFSKPTPLQLIEKALPVVSSVLPKHVYDGTDIATNPANAALIGTGPFVWGEYKPGQYYLLKRNPSYWQAGLPLAGELVFSVLPDRASAASALEAGEVQLAAFSAVPLVDLARVGAVPGLAVITKGYEALTYQLIVEINHRNPQLADLRVRQAIAHAIDRKFVRDTIFLGHAAEATGPVPANDPTFYTADVTPHPFDPEKAKALLDAAGFKAGADGKRFTLRLLPAPYFTETRQFGDYLRQALAVVGIEATIVAHDAPGHLKAVYTDHDFDLAVAPPVFRADPAISTTNLVRSGLPAGVNFSNQGGYASAELDGIIAKAAETVDADARTALYRTFQQRVAAELPLINVAEWGFITVARDTVLNVASNPRWAVSNWADTALQS
jgi:peptide/nickel transport system substrate-binding protein